MLYDNEEKTQSVSTSTKPPVPNASTTPFAGSPTKQPTWMQSMVNAPPAGVQVPATSADKREFVNTTIVFLHSGAEYYRAGAVVDESRLHRQLVGWKETLLGSSSIIRSSLNNDAALEQKLRQAYQDAVESLMNAAASQLKRDKREFYAAYREHIQEWAGLYLTSTPVGQGAVYKGDGSVALQAGGIPVIVKPDTFSQTPGRSADTTFQFDQWKIDYQTTGNKVTAFTPPKLAMSIQTAYQHDADPNGQSGYGKGTTPKDIKEGKTSLRYHEGSHGQDFIRYLNDHPLPGFTGAKGMTSKKFDDAIKKFGEDIEKYSAAMKAFSTAGTDCVGITIDEYNHVHGVKCK